MKAKTFILIRSLVLISLTPSISYGQSKQNQKIGQAVEVLNDFESMKDKIPHQLYEQTEGIIIIPKMFNAGLGIGGKRGSGVAMSKMTNGEWSDPCFITITGGSIGFQAGVQSVDLILFVKHRSSINKIARGSFTLGGDISASAGPFGRSLTASTDYKFNSEIYSYSRSKGVFAGLSLNGADLSINDKSNERFYGFDHKAEKILSSADNIDSRTLNSLKEVLYEMKGKK